MKHYLGLDVAMKETAIGIVDDGRRIVREAVPQAAARQPSAGIAIGRAAPAQMTDLIRAYLTRQQNWLKTHEQDREATTELLENDLAAGRALIEGPRFARWDASIAKQQLDWPCQYRPDGARASR